MAPSPDGLVSTALDRCARIHSTYPPPIKAGQQQEQKGEVLEKIFLKSVPTVVAWDPFWSEPVIPPQGEDDVWDTMENVEDD